MNIISCYRCQRSPRLTLLVKNAWRFTFMSRCVVIKHKDNNVACLTIFPRNHATVVGSNTQICRRFSVV